MYQPFAGKSVVVTGGGRGIGRATSLQLAELGAYVVVNDYGVESDGTGADASAAQDVVQEIKAAGGDGVAHHGDVSNLDDAQELIQVAVSSTGRLDGVVNNAGILRDSIFHKMSAEDFNAVLDVHLRGSFNVSRSAATVLREQGSGVFVHMTSNSALIGNIAQANYSSAKAGIIGLSRSIALDMARYSVRSNAVAPTAWSRLTATIPTNPDEESRADAVKAYGPESVARFVAFLLTDEAKHITGQVFSVRGREVHLMSQPRPMRTIIVHEDSQIDLADRYRFLSKSLAESRLVPLEESKHVFPL